MRSDSDKISAKGELRAENFNFIVYFDLSLCSYIVRSISILKARILWSEIPDFMIPFQVESSDSTALYESHSKALIYVRYSQSLSKVKKRARPVISIFFLKSFSKVKLS